MERVRTSEPVAKERFLVHEGLLYTYRSDGRLVVCLPKSLAREVIELYHREFGHYGAYKTWRAINRDVWFPNQLRKIKQVVRECELCQKTKNTPDPKYVLEPILPQGPNDLLSVDFFGPLPKSTGGVQYLLVTLDIFSKYVMLYPIRRATTDTVINRL